MMRKVLDCFWLSLLSILFAFAITASIGAALAQTHVHPTEVLTGKVAEFYSTWMQPNAPQLSCCNEKDCYATPSRMVDGHIYARHRESGEWIEVPSIKVELNRDSPDGRSHLCATSHKVVLCFIFGSGT